MGSGEGEVGVASSKSEWTLAVISQGVLLRKLYDYKIWFKKFCNWQ
jgi:hypothetical protein